MKETKECTSPEVFESLLDLIGKMHSVMVRTGSELGISPAQAMTLRSLTEPRAMNRLATRLGCDPSNVTGLVDRLEASGLVQRVPDPSDRRVKMIELTSAGVEARSKVVSDIEGEFGLCTRLSDKEQEQLLGLLEKIVL